MLEKLNCNVCWRALKSNAGDGSNSQTALPNLSTCWKTSCDHVFCEECAYKTKGTLSSCPACGQDLNTDEDVVEIQLSEDAVPASKMLSEIYRNPGYWLQVCQKAYKFTRFQWFQEAERQRFLNEQEKLDHQNKFGEIADHYRELRDNKKQLESQNTQLRRELKDKSRVVRQLQVKTQSNQRDYERQMIQIKRQYKNLQEIYSKRRNEGHNWNSRAWNNGGGPPMQDSSGHRMSAPSFSVSDFMVSNVHSKPRRADFMNSKPVLLGSTPSSKRRHQSTESRGFHRAIGPKIQRRPRPKTPTADKRAKSAHENRDSGWNQRQLLPKTPDVFRVLE